LLLNQLLSLSDEHAEVMLPGYTHLLPAMPSTFGLWFGSYAESLCDDIDSLHFAGRAVNASPSGTAAGYGTTLPLKREIIADLLGFDRLIVNSAYAQLRRGKAEKCAADAIASVAFTLGRLAGDIILFLTKEFSFISFSDSLTTGSSIMPQKKNPDVFEIVRARANLLRSLPNTLSMMTTNLPSGYNRDFQVMKEVIFPAIEEVKSLIAMTSYMMRGITVRHDIIDSSYNMIFSAEAVNELVINGVPFREAYRTVALTVGRELFRETTTADYSHIGSMGNTGNEAVLSRASCLMAEFQTATASDLVSGIISG
jgi:argininosuccinate lyase